MLWNMPTAPQLWSAGAPESSTVRPCPTPSTGEHTRPSQPFVSTNGGYGPQMRKKSPRGSEGLVQGHTSHTKELGSKPRPQCSRSRPWALALAPWDAGRVAWTPPPPRASVRYRVTSRDLARAHQVRHCLQPSPRPTLYPRTYPCCAFICSSIKWASQ